MIRVRVSTLEKFRRLVQTEYEDDGGLAAYIRAGQDSPAPSWQAAAGTAWHDALRSPDAFAYHGKEDEPCFYSGAYRFHVQDIYNARTHLGPGVREVPGRLWFDTRGVRGYVEGTADQLTGLVIQDDKTKFSPADPADYFESLQWRWYLLIHHGVCFRYNLWNFKDPTDGGYCELRGVDSFRVWPYPGMRDDCFSWLGSFLAWAADRNLIPYLSARKAVVS